MPASEPGIIDVTDAGYEGSAQFIIVSRNGNMFKIFIRLLSETSKKSDSREFDSGFQNGSDVKLIFGDSYKSENWIQLNVVILYLLRVIFDHGASIPILRINVSETIKICKNDDDFTRYFKYLHRF